jgi:hypothetical protein
MQMLLMFPLLPIEDEHGANTPQAGTFPFSEDRDDLDIPTVKRNKT